MADFTYLELPDEYRNTNLYRMAWGGGEEDRYLFLESCSHQYTFYHIKICDMLCYYKKQKNACKFFRNRDNEEKRYELEENIIVGIRRRLAYERIVLRCGKSGRR